MNLYYTFRKCFSLGCLVAAILYAFVISDNLPIIVRIADGGIYGLIIFSTGLPIWNILRFVIPVNNTPKFRFIFISVLAIITSLLITGFETVAFYLCFPSTFSAFVPTLPARIFISFLLSLIFCLFYLYYLEKTEEKRNLPDSVAEEKPADSSNPTSLISSDRSIERITVRSGTKIKIIPIENILYIQADGDYISIHTTEGQWLKEQTMNYTENCLPIDSFVRIHRSFIVNIRQISRIERYGEKQLIVLNNNEKIKVSSARYQILKQVLGL